MSAAVIGTLPIVALAAVSLACWLLTRRAA